MLSLPRMQAPFRRKRLLSWRNGAQTNINNLNSRSTMQKSDTDRSSSSCGGSACESLSTCGIDQRIMWPAFHVLIRIMPDNSNL